MRKLLTLFLGLSIVLSPVACTVAAALGGSGECIHFDHVWHSVDHHHADGSTDGVWSAADHQADKDAVGETGSLKRSHAECLHMAAFLVSPSTTLSLSPTRDLAVPQISFPVKQHPHPPFRPPQAA